MNKPDQAAGGDWRMQIKDMRTIAALRADDPSREAAERLTDRALLAAAQNPDHSDAGRTAAAAEARARNVSVTPWRLRVPGFLTAADLGKGERLFIRWPQRWRLIWRAAAALAAIVALLTQLLGFERINRAADGVVEAWRSWSGGANPLWLLVGALGLVLLVAVLDALLRAKPARIAVFAPPPTALTRAPLARFIRRELRAFGHVLLHALDGPIRSAGAYRTAAARMGDKFAMNLRAMRPSGVALRIGGAGGWTPFTRALGEGSADALIVDLSQDADVALAALSADPARCVFVALWGKLEAAQAALNARGISAIAHHYAPDGEIQRRAAFRAALIKAMSA